jgi:Subtilase family/PatG Domain/PatG C-terminal
MLNRSGDARGRMNIGMARGTTNANHAFAVAVIDGPYNPTALSHVLANAPTSLAGGHCDAHPNAACDHGTFILGLLGARRDSLIPGLCPDCRLLHIPLFADTSAPSANVDELATAIATAVADGARLVNLSLAILGPESEVNPRLADALDFAEANGSVLLVAAGNQGRPIIGQLLRHPVVIPVAAVDASLRLLPESNFGPVISRRGVAALGRMPGYAPDGGITVMSGTSVAVAVATGILAQLWSARPDIDGARLRSAVASLGPRNGVTPPMLSRELVSAALAPPQAVATVRAIEPRSHVSLQGERTMVNGNEQPPSPQLADFAVRPPQTVTPAGCGCGAPDGHCTCYKPGAGLSGFVYATGTIEADYPNTAIEREMQILARHLGVEGDLDRSNPTRLTEDRHWQYTVLSTNRKLTRYIARQLRWRLTIEGFPVFVLSPGDPDYLDDMIDALARPKYAKPETRGRKRAAEPKTSSIEVSPGHADDLDVVIGVAGARTADGIAVLTDQIFQITSNQLAPDGMTFYAQVADNYGLTDEDRAFNFLAARYTPPLSQIEGFELAGMRMTPSRLGLGSDRIVRAIYTLRNEAMAEKEFFLRVDVTNEFPMIVSPWQPYMERGDRA